jgi:CrcB protein
MAELLVVAICGGLGAVLRSVLGKFNGFIPWGILIANTAATAVAAWVLLAAPQLGLVLIAGVAGGLSTFSTFVQQTWQLLNQGKRVEAFVNLVFNIVLPSTAVALVILCL